MKNYLIFLLVAILSGCQALSPQTKGRMIIKFESVDTCSEFTKAFADVDTDEYILSVSNSKGAILYEGKYGDSPEYFELGAGTYTVSAVSCSFEEPCYERAQYGDTKVVLVKSGETIAVGLHCEQLNAGLKLDIDDSFIDSFPDGEIYLKTSDGELLYEYTERRVAYFKPGSVKIEVVEGDTRQNLLSRTLKARQILRISIASSTATATDGIKVYVDTTREYCDYNYIYGIEQGSDYDTAMDITEARENAGMEDVWVCGYIVGCASGTSTYCYEEPFPKATNILLGLRSGTTDKDYCLSVELRSGSIREELNLMSNPELRGSKVYIKGDLVSSYFGIPGLKNISEYSL